jgi:Rab9 effector protein with kelch motifs
MPSSLRSASQIRIPSVTDQDATSMSQRSGGGLSDVPEEGTTPRSPALNSPYNPTHHHAAASTSTFHASSPPPSSSPATGSNAQPAQSSSVSRKSSGGVRDRERLGREATGSSGSLRKQALAPSKSSGSLAPPGDSKESKKSATDVPAKPRIRVLPRLPHVKDVELAPTTSMYWSKGPVYGHLPMRGMKAHSATLVDNIAWLFGGCDGDKGCWNDIYCFDTGAVIKAPLQSYTLKML